MTLQSDTTNPATACPYCRAGFEPDEEITVCEACLTPHHADCYAENGGCTVFGCSKAPVDEPKISITASETRQATRHAAFPAALPPVVATPTPPPPRLPGATSAVPPPPRPFVFRGFAAYGPSPATGISFGGYNPSTAAISPFVRRRSRLTFILLGVLLGPFGGHNFYAGYIQRAVVQLLLTVLSCFFGAIISWIWAIVEICTVTQDDDGVAFI